jgi:hypothetical protein
MRRRITVSATLLAIANVGSAASPSSGREAAVRRAAQQPLAAAAANDVFAINDGLSPRPTTTSATLPTGS